MSGRFAMSRTLLYRVNVAPGRTKEAEDLGQLFVMMRSYPLACAFFMAAGISVPAGAGERTACYDARLADFGSSVRSLKYQRVNHRHNKPTRLTNINLHCLVPDLVAGAGTRSTRGPMELRRVDRNHKDNHTKRDLLGFELACARDVLHDPPSAETWDSGCGVSMLP